MVPFAAISVPGATQNRTRIPRYSDMDVRDAADNFGVITQANWRTGSRDQRDPVEAHGQTGGLRVSHAKAPTRRRGPRLQGSPGCKVRTGVDAIDATGDSIYAQFKLSVAKAGRIGNRGRRVTDSPSRLNAEIRFLEITGDAEGARIAGRVKSPFGKEQSPTVGLTGGQCPGRNRD